MYQKIMVPVDLAHLETLQKSLRVAVDIARLYEAEIYYISITSSLPGKVARTPEEYTRKLEEFADEQGETHGLATSARTFLSHDPVADMDEIIVSAAKRIGADLIVMATQLPGRLNIFLPTNGSRVARHTEVSVFLVRS
ncbi:universal stress protein [Pistricoccus aurantiacus]|uniref:Universal stress protein n=1 Tax=Pistricoccus aurantiacus TaxID=1883414 RepID=A0A5B8SX76_9GAMM|nr:universal stress protein [Pistricoccus aurantiacus]QEA39523.1 universal stress protein [Pistricoccus aurantiacus]